MFKYLRMLVVAGLGLVSHGVNAYTGNDLYADCTANDNSYDFCLGYVTGYYAGYKGVSHCDLSNVTTGQSIKIFIKLMDDNPHLLHEPARLLLPLSMLEALNCPTVPE